MEPLFIPTDISTEPGPEPLEIGFRVLPSDFNKDGYYYTQVWRNAHFAIYAQFDAHVGDFIAFEVIRVLYQKEKIREIRGNPVRFTACEVYPSTEKWGQSAFTVWSLDQAWQKIRNWQKKTAG